METDDMKLNEFTEKYPFLMFKDWLTKRPYESENWLVVAQYMNISGSQILQTHCALASAGSDHLKKLTANPFWEINRCGGDYFGAPYFHTSLTNGDDIEYRTGQYEKIDGIMYQPLILHRDFKDRSLNRLEVSQVFILYFNAFYVESEGVYQKINERGDRDTVIKIVKPKDDETVILVNTHLLRSYLAANKSYLVRYHDHRRFTSGKISEKHPMKFRISSEHSCFDIAIYDHSAKEYGTCSTIIGKDIIEPYPMPNEPHYHNLRRKKERRFVKFIIDHDESGEEIEETCNEDELSSNFKDRGKPHFLTSVYFRKEVLVKYINQPLWKSVGIPYDTTPEGLVRVWLGDLGRASYEDQLYWRSFNIPPSGPLPRDVFMRDIMGIFAEPKGNVIYNFRRTYELLQKKSNDAFSQPFFKPLRDRDEHIEVWLRLPIVDTPKEFDDIMLGLAKLTNDSLNVNLLESLSGKKIDKKSGIKGSIDLLSIYLENLSIDSETKENILLGFNMVQALRSAGAAHRSGNKFLKKMKQFKLEGMTTTKAVERVVVQFTQSLRLLIWIIDSGN